ncbi:MAG: MFS transporter [Deltaproteobacteria bacterium]|nr:MFS transporter [Deltaproteobacteria bacterium]
MSENQAPKNEQPKSMGRAIADSFREVGETFVHLAHAPRALWGINVSYLLEGLAYFGVLTILGIYLAEDVGLRESHASLVLSFLTGGITLSMLLLGGVSDRIGVRKALLVALSFMILGRFFLAASGTFFSYGEGANSLMFVSLMLGLLLVVIGYGMYQPAAYAGVKQFTNKKTAAIGYAMIYALMNLGAFFSGIISPPVRHASGMVGVYWVYVAMTVAAFLSVLFILTRRTAEKAKERVKAEDLAFGEEEASEEPKPAKNSVAKSTDERSLFNPTTIILTTLFLGSVAIFLTQFITAPVHPLKQSCEDLAKETKNAAKTLKTGKTPAQDLKALWKQTAANLKPTADASSVDETAFVLARLQLENMANQWPTDTKGQWTLEAEHEQGMRRILRVHALRLMTAAYALVAPVDGKVVDKLRLRLKQPSEETLPVSAPEQKTLVRLASSETLDMLKGLVQSIPAIAQQAEVQLPQGLGQILGSRLKADEAFLSGLTESWNAQTGEDARALLTETLLSDSLFYRDLANSLVDLENPGKTKPWSAAEFWTLAMNAKAEMLKEVYAQRLPEATPIDSMEKWKTIGLRYGTSFFPALLFLVLLTWWLLKLRPDHPFHNKHFTFFIFVLIPVQTLFAHNWLTLPFYINRAFAGTALGENFEFFSNINPVLIFFLTPLVAAMTSRARVYPMMMAGTLVMALPTFLLALPPSPVLLMSYILLMSIGEAMWQPRFLQLVAEIAPEGKTGAYMGIAQLPWFMTKVFVGFYAGWFVVNYCPSVGPQNTEFMWLVYAFIAMITPLGLWLAKGWIGSTMERKAA